MVGVDVGYDVNREKGTGMYSALWKILPGPRWAKTLQAIALVIVVLGVCLEWVFPWIAENFIQTESTVGQ